MEFNGIVNKFLHKDAESRHRQLHIRTYVRVLHFYLTTQSVHFINNYITLGIWSGKIMCLHVLYSTVLCIGSI